MTCLRCRGLTVRERVQDFFHPFWVWRCLLCGAVLDRTILRNQQASIGRGADVPKFRSEAHRQNWIESMRLKREAKGRQQTGTTQLPVPVKPTALVPHVQRAVPRGMDVLAVIDQTLVMLEQDRAALERVKEILSR